MSHNLIPHQSFYLTFVEFVYVKLEEIETSHTVSGVGEIVMEQGSGEGVDYQRVCNTLGTFADGASVSLMQPDSINVFRNKDWWYV